MQHQNYGEYSVAKLRKRDMVKYNPPSVLIRQN